MVADITASAYPGIGFRNHGTMAVVVVFQLFFTKPRNSSGRPTISWLP